MSHPTLELTAEQRAELTALQQEWRDRRDIVLQEARLDAALVALVACLMALVSLPDLVGWPFAVFFCAVMAGCILLWAARVAKSSLPNYPTAQEYHAHRDIDMLRAAFAAADAARRAQAKFAEQRATKTDASAKATA